LWSVFKVNFDENDEFWRSACHRKYLLGACLTFVSDRCVGRVRT
jgi:hypothetical protein